MNEIFDEASLFQKGKRITLEKGDVLHSPNDVCHSLGQVVKGRLRLSRILSSEKEIVVKEFLPDELFAEMMVFTKRTYPGWLIASEPSVVVEVELPHILSYLEDRGNLMTFFAAVSEKMTHLSNTIEIMSLKTVKQKIAFFLLSGTASTVETTKALKNVSRLAEQVNCSRESVSRALSEMERMGVVTKTPAGRRIADLERLEELF